MEHFKYPIVHLSPRAIHSISHVVKFLQNHLDIVSMVVISHGECTI